MTGVPGLRGVEHIGVTVPDLEQALTFFTDVLGCERLYDMGPFADPEGTWMSDNLNVHPRAEIDNFALVRCANGANFELFEYRSPDKNTRWPRLSDDGGTHIAFYVDDMDAALGHLAAHGVDILGDGKKDGIGPEGGVDASFAHFRTPWGQVLEFVSYPHGRAHDSTTDRHGWRPAAS